MRVFVFRNLLKLAGVGLHQNLNQNLSLYCISVVLFVVVVLVFV